MQILGKSIADLQALIGSRKIKVKEVQQYFLKRVRKYNPTLNAFLTVQDQDEMSPINGVLAGIPFAVKDNFCTKGIRTTASSCVLDQFIPPYESTVTMRLLSAGATILGKTNMDAWAHGSSTETSDYGPTKNPWDVSRVPGGSSGGSTAAVSAYLTPAAIGSETAGSIRQPAAWTGVVGLKPSYGRVSRYGVIAMGSSFDCPGPLTLTVKDAAILLGVIAGKDPFDGTSSNIPTADYKTMLKTKKFLTIGIAKEYMEGMEESLKLKIEESLRIFQKLGHRIKTVSLLSPKYAISVYTIIQRAEVSSNLARYDGIRYGNDRTFFAAEAKRRTMLGAYTLSFGYYDAYYKKAQKVRTLIVEDFKRAFKDVDVIVAASTPISALKLGEFAKYPFFGELMDVLNEPAAIAGIPAISVPCGQDKNGLPVGLQIMGNYFDEATILNLAFQFEKETEFFGVIKKGIARYQD